MWKINNGHIVCAAVIAWALGVGYSVLIHGETLLIRLQAFSIIVVIPVSLGFWLGRYWDEF